MSDEQHFRKLERMYLAAPINQFYRPEIRIDQGQAQVKIKMRPEFHHAANAVHGAVYFKALDDATFFAASSLIRGHFLLTISFNLYFTRPISEGEMLATASVVQHSRRLLVAEGQLVDEKQRVIAHGSGAFMHSQIPLTPELGYR